MKHIYIELPDPSAPFDKLAINTTNDVISKVITFCSNEKSNATDSQNKQGYLLGLLFKSIAKRNLTAYCVDDPSCDQNDLNLTEQRNEYMATCIKYLNQRLGNDEKYLVVTGLNHHHLAELLDIPMLFHTSMKMGRDHDNRYKLGYINVEHDFLITHTALPNLRAHVTYIESCISPFQNIDDESDHKEPFIYPNDLNVDASTIQQLTDIQAQTKLSLSLEIGRPITQNSDSKELSYSNDSSTLRLIINRRNESKEFFQSIFQLLKDHLNTAHPLLSLFKRNKVEINEDKIKLTFENNISFKQVIAKLHELFVKEKMDDRKYPNPK